MSSVSIATRNDQGFHSGASSSLVRIVASMADPPRRGAGDGGKIPWNMKIGKLKPGARETITDKKLATFVAGKQKKSRLQKASTHTSITCHHPLERIFFTVKSFTNTCSTCTKRGTSQEPEAPSV